MTSTNDIPRLRAEAQHWRENAKIARGAAARCKERGDLVGKLKADLRVTEYVREAQARDKLIKSLKQADQSKS